MAHPTLDYDYCSCVKEEGCWGESGWHFRTAGELECFRRYPDRDDHGACMRGLNRNRCLDAGGCKHQGAALAYERCPAWSAARQRKIDERRREESRKTAETIFADDEER
ncbi:MAG TPA: hypothetical protein VKA48_08340 [Gammaproteobacteria bacterium]|nr:hypothetical protein [Gammaproteobacteria bacterium]